MTFHLFRELGARGHEQVTVFQRPELGLKAVVAIHSTALGPSLGGCRLRLYDDEEEALEDVLRLSEGMTFKSAMAGMPLGGGKACILIDPNFTEKRRELFQEFGRCVDSLQGRYITAEDMGTTEADIQAIRESTKYATGGPMEKGGAGDPSPWTAKGVRFALKAAAERCFGSADLTGRSIAVQGVGHVGRYLLDELVDSGVTLYVCDTYEPTLEEIRREYDVTVVDSEAIYDCDADFFSPCAIGQTVNPDTIPRLKCRAIVGAANNQLSDPSVYESLQERKILYLPDFVVNSGGVISVGAELNPGGWERGWVTEKVEAIYDTTHEVLAEAEKRGLFTEAVAVQLAKERINSKRRA